MRRLIAGKYKKVVLGAVAVFFAFSNFYFLAFLKVNQAQAQAQVVIDPTQAAIQIPWKGFVLGNYSKEEILNDLKATFFKNVVANLARQFAKASAKWIVSGGKGNKPFWETDVFGSIVDAGQAAFEDWLTAAISNSIGLDLCKFDPTLTLNIALTQPNKPDKIAKQKSIIGGGTAQGCSFEDLKEKFSTEGKDWQDFVKIKATEIGPDTTKNIQQLSRDISNNQTVKQNNAGVPGFSSPPVLTYLNTQTNRLGTMNNDLNSDTDALIAKKGTNESVTLKVDGKTYPVSAEYINDIKKAWNTKISSGKAEASAQRSKYSRCRGKGLSAWLIDPCATTLKDLGYTLIMPGWIQDNPDKAQDLEREIQAKLENIDKMYNSLSIGYDSLSKFVNQQIKPEMFQSAGLYTWQKAKTQFEPQADPATSTSQQVASGSAEAKTKAEERKKTEVSTAGGWKGSVDKISGYIKTPADILKAKTIESLSKEDSALDYTKSIVADSLGVFLAELQNLYVQQLLMALSNPKQQRSSGSGSGSNKEEQGLITEEGVNLYYESLSQGFNFTLPDLDLLQEFQTSITGKKINPNIYNNVIDLNFALAIQQRMTISDALTQGKLNGNARFSASETLEPNTYNLSNLRKLRKARVIPLGLELAAELIRDCNYRNILDDKGDTAPDYNEFQDSPNGYNNNPANFTGQRLQNCFFKVNDSQTNIRLMQATLNATLNDVVNGFDLRGDDGICGTYDSGESPFCNLVDPEWVLKLPATKCLQTIKNEAYGEILQDNESGSRYSRCADFVSCLDNDTQNSCQSSNYGVCVKEKNVWRLSGDTCDNQYDSCRAYTAIDSNGKKNNVAYLKNTLDPAGCGADTIGCKGYTRNYDNNKFYFNNNVQTCEIANDGCHEFISDPISLTNFPTLPTAYDAAALSTRIYYRVNPSCTPTSTDPNCANYMQTCTDEQIGCALYKPVSGGPTVSAVIKQEDQCPAECNGFSAFFRQPTNFEPAEEIAEIDYFVANTARTCPAASVGCSQFTNLDLVAQGGEGIEYYTNLRQCIKPGSNLGEKTYFTWQSIADGPQQLIKYVLQDDSLLNNNTTPNPTSEGAPKTYDGSGTCDPDVNNNCLTFYDSTGETFLRDVTKTIIVTDDCHPYRKTIATQTACEQTNGNWENNVCIYNAVPSLSQACPAADAGCYIYLGSSGRNVFTVFSDDFETVSLPAGYDTTTGVSLSGESYTTPGNSLEIAIAGRAVRSTALSSGNYYVLEFLAKGTGQLVISNFGEITLTDVWVNYTLGPITPESDLTSLSFINQTGAIVNIDNVKLLQEKANYLIKDSWSLPACTFADLNCEAYLGPKEQTFYLKSFSSLCPENKVGCQYLIDTRNTLSPQAQDYSGVLIPADKKAAYVVDTKYKCTAEFKGCEKFTEPVLSGGGVVYDTTYLLNDPETYLGTRGILCQAEAEGCTELINEKGYSEYYKIDPTKICQYTQNYIPALSQNVWGWYVAGASTTTSCQGTQNPPYDVYEASDALYDGYTAACPVKMSGCSGFQTINSNATPVTPAVLSESDCLAKNVGSLDSGYVWINNECVKDYYGQTYFVLDKENNIDRSSCTAVDWNKGCVAFKNNAANEVQTIKVQKDRDCAEWVDCVSKDEQGNCIKMVASYTTPEGNIETSKIITPDLPATLNLPATPGAISVLAERDNVRYSASSLPLIVNRKTYVKRFAGQPTVANPNPVDNAIGRWDIGDYSGYTIPDRYPLETEILKKFTTYPLEKENLSTDPRFSSPVCKVFAEEDSPVPYEVTRKSGYTKIQNLYSQTVTVSDIADGCNYDTVETEGVTTYFPFAYFSTHLLEDDPQICTGVPSLNGKLCQGKIDKLDNEPENAACKSSSEQKNAYCRPVENIKTNFGIQGRCLEMDLLNPLYGGVQKGSYACLSYFPFQYNECGSLSGNKAECERLPACSYVNNQCVAEICQFYKDKNACEGPESTKVTAPNGDQISQCLWDGGANGGSGACLFKKCTLATVTDAASCRSLAPYCQWYGNRCIEDICVSSYSQLSENGIVSHPEPDADLCMNPGDLSAVAKLGDLYNNIYTGKGDYCAWQARNDPNPDKNGRWQFSCQLKCEIKYPSDDLLTNKTACIDDKYCQWSNPACVEYCSGKNLVQCNAEEKCAWDADAGCVDKCQTFTGDTFDQCPSTPTETAQCARFEKCADSCAGKAETACTGVCTWNGTACLDICKSKTSQSECTSVTDGTISLQTPNPPQICSWNNENETCSKQPTYECSSLLSSASCRTDLGCNWTEICYNPTLEGYTLTALGIVNNTKTSVCSSKTDEGTCDAQAYCAWGSGSCVTEKNLKGCEVHKFAVSDTTLANKGADCRKGFDGIAGTADDCGWWFYTYSHYDKNIGCFPLGYTETCFECLAPKNSNTCHDPGCSINIFD